MKSLTWRQVWQRRLARNHLLKPAPRSQLANVVRSVCGIHAQVMGAAELSIRARVAGITQNDVRDELWNRRTLVKTYGPRDTLHLLPADELPLWMAAMRARLALAERRPREPIGLTPAQIRQAADAIGEALDGKCLTREELSNEVTRRVGSWAREGLISAWGDAASGQAAYHGLLCFGPPQGAKVTFVRADQWIGGWQDIDPHEALLEILRRYLAAYGPATHQDFAEWFNLKPAQARELLQSIADELKEVNVEGRRAWLLSGDVRIRSGSNQHALNLLPQYDCYIMGCREREQLVPPIARARIATHPRGRFEGPAAISWMLIEGIVAGMWERHKRGKRLDLDIELFGHLTSTDRRALEAEAADIGQFMKAEVRVAINGI